MSLAPIVLFIYNRPQHTLRTLEALAANGLAKDSELYIFADGGKVNASSEALKIINETRNIAKSRQWCMKTVVTESAVNKGLAQSVIDGVSEVIRKHGKVIVLEDDLVTSPFFLGYMNEALDLYESDTSVACVSGYIYPVKGTLPETFFMKGADCWGWATWARAWKELETDGGKLLAELENRSLTREFDFDDTYPYTKMLKDQIEGKNDSWAIRWYASAFLRSRYCLYPGISLVQNIGMDGTGTHSNSSDRWNVNIANKAPVVSAIPVKENDFAKKQVITYFKSLQPSRLDTLKAQIKGIIRKTK